MGKCLATSEFKTLYDVAARTDESACPTLQHQVFAALHDFLRLCARRDGVAVKEADGFFQRLQEEVLRTAAGLDEALGDVPRIAQRVWTSDQILPTPAGAGREFCSLLNEAIRADDLALLQAAMPLIRAINSLCVVRGARPDCNLRFPPDNTCYRGGGLPDRFQAFFQPEVKYRAAGFLATSFDREVTGRFRYKAFEEDGLPAVLWVIRLHPRGARDVTYRCKQVNYVVSSKFGDEEAEFLFAPYSVFTVKSVELKPKATYLDPHVITLEAAIDNRLEPEDLPLAPWY